MPAGYKICRTLVALSQRVAPAPLYPLSSAAAAASGLALAEAGMPVTIFMFFEPLAYLDTWKESRSVRLAGASQIAFDGPICPGAGPADGKGAEDGTLGLAVSVTVTVSVTVVGVADMVIVVRSSSVTVNSAMGAKLDDGADVMYEKENGYWLSLGMMGVSAGDALDSVGGARSRLSISLMWVSGPRRRRSKRSRDPGVTWKGARAGKDSVLFMVGAATISCSPPRKRRHRTVLEAMYKRRFSTKVKQKLLKFAWHLTCLSADYVSFSVFRLAFAILSQTSLKLAEA